MQQASEPLIREFERLKSTFASLRRKLAEATEQSRASSVPVPPTLASEVSGFKKSVAELGQKVVELGRMLSLTPDLPVATLDDLDRSLQVIAAIEEAQSSRTKALAVLDRVGELVHRDRGMFRPLIDLQAEARELRDQIAGFPGHEVPAVAQELADGRHVISRLLDLVENQSKLTDAQCLRFHELVEKAFGKDLAIAATRGKLQMQHSSVPSLATAEVAAKAFERGATNSAVSTPDRATDHSPDHSMDQPLRASGNSGLQAEIDQEIDAILANISELASKTKDGSPIAGKSGGNATMRPADGNSAAGAGRAAEPPSPPKSAATEIGDAVLEAIRIEEEADRYFAQGKHAEAEELYQKLLSIQKTVFGPRDPVIARTMRNLTLVRQAQGTIAPAEPTVAHATPEVRKAEAPAYTSELVIPGSDAAPVKKGTAFRWMIVAAVVLAVFTLIYDGVRYYRGHGASVASVQTAPPSVPPPPSALTAAPEPAPAPVQQPQPIAQPQAAPTQSAEPKPNAQQAASVPPPAPEIRLSKPVRQRETQTASNVATPASEPVEAAAPKPISQPEPPPAPAPKPVVRKEVPEPPRLSAGLTGKSSTTDPGALIAPVAPAPPPPSVPITGPVRMSEASIAARLISSTKPVYPTLARQARIQGTVRLEAIIGKTGSIEKLSVVSGHSLLRQAAIDAVKQWRYQPIQLNGMPVEVITTVDINFRLDQ